MALTPQADKNLVVCIIGESGCGKTTLIDALQAKYHYATVDSYTTRPKRFEDEKGHIFLNADLVYYDSLCNQFIYTHNGQIHYYNPIAMTYFDKHYYWVTKEQLLGKGIILYVIDPKGYEALTEQIPYTNRLAIYLQCSESIRFKRLSARDGQEKATERIVHDRNFFQFFPTDYIVHTDTLSMKDLCPLINRLIQKKCGDCL